MNGAAVPTALRERSTFQALHYLAPRPDPLLIPPRLCLLQVSCCTFTDPAPPPRVGMGVRSPCPLALLQNHPSNLSCPSPRKHSNLSLIREIHTILCISLSQHFFTLLCNCHFAFFQHQTTNIRLWKAKIIFLCNFFLNV